jgi:hypothetical protein
MFLSAALVGAIPLCAVAFSQENSDIGLALFWGVLTFWCALSVVSYFKWKPFLGVIFGTIAMGFLTGHFLPGHPWAIAGAVTGAFFLQAGLHDYLQPKHSLERAFPLLASPS